MYVASAAAKIRQIGEIGSQTAGLWEGAEFYCQHPVFLAQKIATPLL
jgi:hypothetical protein